LFFTKKTSEETNCKKTKFAEGRYGQIDQNDEAHHLEHVNCIFKITSEQSSMSNNDDNHESKLKRLLDCFNSIDVGALLLLMPEKKLPIGSVEFPNDIWYRALDARVKHLFNICMFSNYHAQ